VEYGFGFFLTALDEIAEAESARWQHHAVATRMAMHADADAFKKFIRSI